MKIANPQGKGLVSLFNEWNAPVLASQCRDFPKLAKDYVLSLFVLSASFKFKPVQLQRYYLYLKQSELILTLIEPSKSGGRFGIYIGECGLNPDLTWHVEFSDDDNHAPTIQSFLQRFYAGFESHHQQNKTWYELLPFYEESLPFYARMYANGMAKSIHRDMVQLGLTQAPASKVLEMKGRLLGFDYLSMRERLIS